MTGPTTGIESASTTQERVSAAYTGDAASAPAIRAIAL